MKRPVLLRIFLPALAVWFAASGGASAAILSLGCMGQLGDQRIVFNRDGLYIVDAKAAPAPAKKFTHETVGDAIEAIKAAKAGFTEFQWESADELDEPPMRFSRTDDGKQFEKVVLTQTSSKRLSHKHRMICGRDEDIDLYRNVYSYARGSEPAREIKMQCFWYQLSTRGDRKGCGDD